MATGFNLPSPLVMEGNLSENWRRFIQKFENFMAASQYTEEKDERKIAIFFNVIGDDASEALNSMTLTNDDKKKYDKVIEAFEKYCNPRKKILYLRYMFYSRNQERDETFDHFDTDLSKLVGDCEFHTQKSLILRDRIVLGMSDKELQARLIRMTDDEVALEKVVEFCRIAEVTKKQLQTVQGAGGAKGVEEVKHKPRQRSSSGNREKNVNPNRSGESFYNKFRSRSKSRNTYYKGVY